MIPGIGIGVGYYPESYGGGWSPLQLANLAAAYDISTPSSLSINGSNQVALVGDLSGNSATNCLCLNGVAGNNATAPDSAALSITGDIDLQAEIAADDWSRAAGRYPISKYGAAGTRSYLLGIAAGAIELDTSADGTAILTHTSTATVPFSNYSRGWIRATIDVNNGSGSRVVKFYTSTDGITWAQLGSTVTTAGTTSIFDSTSVLTLGQFTGAPTSLEGRIYRARILNGYDGAGSVVFDANLALASKLASSFTESSSNAATVTINTTGDLGARITGARDLVNLTNANKPVYTAAGAYLTFDGNSQYLKTAAFSSGQPFTLYLAMQQVTWTSLDHICDGNSVDSAIFYQNSATPLIYQYAGTLGANVSLALTTNAVVSGVFNGASSSIRLNRAAASSANAGAGAPNGFTLGSKADSSQAANIRVYGVYIFSAAHDTTTQNQVIAYLGAKYGISV